MYTTDAVAFGATHYLPMKDGITPQLFYKQNSGQKLEYISCRGLWKGSATNNDDTRIKHLFNKLIKI